MKKIIIPVLCGLAFLASCSNDDIVVEAQNKTELNVNVSLSNFFQCYNFTDTRNDINVLEDQYRVFHSEYGKYIQVRTLFYNNAGLLVDSVLTYASSTNAVTQKIALAEGTYTAITTLTFADKDEDNDKVYYSWWGLCDKENLSTVYLFDDFGSRWSILSYAAQTVTVSEDETNVVSVTPKPVGALCYIYLQNFQYKNQATYGTVADNGIRQLTLYTRQSARGYKLNPNASEKYIYNEDAGQNMWWYLSDGLTPASFSDDWTFFKSNLYSYCYILAPSFDMCFGYILKNETNFNAYGQAHYNIMDGKMYLAYWDWFKVGNPYFGLATNNKWNNYDK